MDEANVIRNIRYWLDGPPEGEREFISLHREGLAQLMAEYDKRVAERDALWQAADAMVSVMDDALNQGEKWPHLAAYDEEAECRVTTRMMTELSWEEMGEYTEALRRALKGKT